jgi:hypothetical protein
MRVKYIVTKDKLNFVHFPSFENIMIFIYNFTLIYFIRFSNEKVFLNTILTNRIQEYLFPTFTIPKLVKFYIQLNINAMESTMVSK